MWIWHPWNLVSCQQRLQCLWGRRYWQEGPGGNMMKLINYCTLWWRCKQYLKWNLGARQRLREKRRRPGCGLLVSAQINWQNRAWKFWCFRSIIFMNSWCTVITVTIIWIFADRVNAVSIVKRTVHECTEKLRYYISGAKIKVGWICFITCFKIEHFKQGIKLVI